MRRTILVPMLAAAMLASVFVPRATTHAQFPPGHHGQVVHYTLSGGIALDAAPTLVSDIDDMAGNDFETYTAPVTFLGDISGSATLTFTATFLKDPTATRIAVTGSLVCASCTVYDPAVNKYYTDSLTIGLVGELNNPGNPADITVSMVGFHYGPGLAFLTSLHPSGIIPESFFGYIGLFAVDLHY